MFSHYNLRQTFLMFCQIKPCLVLTVTVSAAIPFVLLSAQHPYPFPPRAAAVIDTKYSQLDKREK